MNRSIQRSEMNAFSAASVIEAVYSCIIFNAGSRVKEVAVTQDPNDRHVILKEPMKAGN